MDLVGERGEVAGGVVAEGAAHQGRAGARLPLVGEERAEGSAALGRAVQAGVGLAHLGAATAAGEEAGGLAEGGVGDAGDEGGAERAGDWSSKP